MLLAAGLISTLTAYSKEVKRIFDPLIDDNKRLVEDQVNLVLVNRLSAGHPNANHIKVCSSQLLAAYI